MFNKRMKEILETLNQLNQFPPRDNEKAIEGKSRFLAQAKLISKSPVTNAPEPRQNNWNKLPKKERKMSTLLAILLAIGLVFGGSTATVYAAQDSTPDELLYPVKTLTEDIALELTMSPETKVELALNYALRRIDEINDLKEAGIMPPDAVYARLENQINLALQQALSLENEDAVRALLRIRDTLQTREQLMDQQLDDPILLRTRTILQERIQLVESGIVDPEGAYNEFRSGWETTPEPGKEATSNGGQPAQIGTAAPSGGPENQPGNPPAENTPVQGNGYPGSPTPGGNGNPGGKGQ